MQYNNWYQNPSDGNWYYLRSWGGALNNGWNRLDDWYYFDGDCTMKKDELVQLDRKRPLLLPELGRHAVQQLVSESIRWKLVLSEKLGGALNNGWNRLDDWYYFNGDCTMKKDELCWLDGNLYYFRSWGGRQYNNWYPKNIGRQVVSL